MKMIAIRLAFLLFVLMGTAFAQPPAFVVTATSPTQPGLLVKLPPNSITEGGWALQRGTTTLFATNYAGYSLTGSLAAVPLDNQGDALFCNMNVGTVKGTTGNCLTAEDNGVAVAAISPHGTFYSAPDVPNAIPVLVNAPAGTTAPMIQIYVGGVSKFLLDANGNLTIAGQLKTSAVAGK